MRKEKIPIFPFRHRTNIKNGEEKRRRTNLTIPNGRTLLIYRKRYLNTQGIRSITCTFHFMDLRAHHHHRSHETQYPRNKKLQRGFPTFPVKRKPIPTPSSHARRNKAREFFIFLPSLSPRSPIPSPFFDTLTRTHLPPIQALDFDSGRRGSPLPPAPIVHFCRYLEIKLRRQPFEFL